MLRILTMIILLRSFSVALSPNMTSYAQMSKNGQLIRGIYDTARTERTSARNGTRVENENRSISDTVSITMSPVYVPVRTPKLKKGETIDHPAIVAKYSTLDHEMITKLDAMMNKQRQIQHRFLAPANFDYANGKPQKSASTSNAEGISNVNPSPFPGPLAPDVYEYSPSGFSNNESPTSKPIINKHPSISTDEKDVSQDTYRIPSPNGYQIATIDAHETNYPDFDVAPPYESDDDPSAPVKPMKFTDHHHIDDQQPPPSFMDDSYDHHNHYDNHYNDHGLIYDHVPELYGDHHYHHKTTTEEPEMNDQRLDKRPYSYYFIGKKLWYIPLYFSIYFIIYIAALVLKSIARHKINFPAHLADTVTSHRKRRESSEDWSCLDAKVLGGMERFVETYMGVS